MACSCCGPPTPLAPAPQPGDAASCCSSESPHVDTTQLKENSPRKSNEEVDAVSSCSKDDCCGEEQITAGDTAANQTDRDTCQDECCDGPLADASSFPGDNGEKHGVAIATDNCKDGCCTPSTKTETCTVPPAKLDMNSSTCKDSDCCDAKKPIPSAEACRDACCGDNGNTINLNVEPAQCLDDCCDTNKSSEDRASTGNDTNTTDCCQGKTSPCCDTSCLDRIALRECKVKCKESRGMVKTKTPKS